MSKDFFSTNFSGLDWTMLMGPGWQNLSRQREREREREARSAQAQGLAPALVHRATGWSGAQWMTGLHVKRGSFSYGQLSTGVARTSVAQLIGELRGSDV